MDETKQMSFNIDQPETDNGPVVCLGMTFKNDEERREYFRNELRKKLLELKKIEGFPIGDDEDIIALSDPPYYTACPNPWINDFIEEWEKEKIDYNSVENYQRNPFVGDVKEGKYEKTYKFHPYATKVPHKAILRYILHYTQPGDIVLDSFSGTGMTGVASHFTNNKEEIESLGYKVDDAGNIYRLEEIEGEQEYVSFSKLGERKVILNDLSTAGSYISYNFNFDDSVEEINELNQVINEIKNKLGWMFKTLHKSDEVNLKLGLNLLSKIKNNKDAVLHFKNSNLEFGDINYVAWSDVFVCPECANEVVYWESAVEYESGIIHEEFSCPKCNNKMKKGTAERAMEQYYDINLKEVVTISKQVPVLINYSIGNSRYIKKPDQFDLELIDLIRNIDLSVWTPNFEIPTGEETDVPRRYGINHIHQFYTNRNLNVLSLLNESNSIRTVGKILTRVATRITKMYGLTYQSGKWGAGGGPLSGTLYIPSLVKELNMIKQISKSLETQKGKDWVSNKNILQSNCSSTSLPFIKDNSIDYIFLDPPFGGNLMYSELNLIWESWLKVFTNNKEEAITSRKHGKDIEDYKNLLVNCFKECFRVLKYGRWLTVEFSNTKASIWNVIQSAITEAGFVIANVSTLDKKKGSFKAITTTTAVKQDLVISAYKPNKETVDKINQMINTEESVWTFVNQHLQQLPVFEGQKGEAKLIAERTPRILFDRMVAYFVQNGLPVPLSSGEFQEGVAQRYPMRDGMAFLESQVAEYDKKRTLVKEFTQLSLFVSDENSAIEWIRQQLMNKPQTRQDLHPEFMKQIQHIAKHEKLPELDDLLEQNFLRYEGEEPVPNQILTYLRRNYKDLRGLEPTDPKVIEKAMERWYVPDPNKQSDLEKLREKALLREFNQYKDEIEGNRKKLRTFRTEAVRAGFKNAYKEKDFETIVKVGDRIPEKVIQEDDKLFMYYENAKIRLGL